MSQIFVVIFYQLKLYPQTYSYKIGNNATSIGKIDSKFQF